ncbi:MAG: DMT family protein [Opitutales bacterium]|nr:DMT family protein [Opitutales bacterium]
MSHPIIFTVVLLSIANVFMTFAWYGHLRHFQAWPWYGVEWSSSHGDAPFLNTSFKFRRTVSASQP